MLDVYRAERPVSRLVGLAGMRRPSARLALLLTGTRAVHTLGMRFALDLVWLDESDRVLRIDAAVAPGRFRGCRRAGAVLELVAGSAALSGLRADEPLSLSR